MKWRAGNKKGGEEENEEVLPISCRLHSIELLSSPDLLPSSYSSPWKNEKKRGLTGSSSTLALNSGENGGDFFSGKNLLDFFSPLAKINSFLGKMSVSSRAFRLI